jgi:hypothetical protein
MVNVMFMSAKILLHHHLLIFQRRHFVISKTLPRKASGSTTSSSNTGRHRQEDTFFPTGGGPDLQDALILQNGLVGAPWIFFLFLVGFFWLWILWMMMSVIMIDTSGTKGPGLPRHSSRIFRQFVAQITMQWTTTSTTTMLLVVLAADFILGGRNGNDSSIE